MNDPLSRAIGFLGKPSEAARRIGISHQRLNQWQARGRLPRTEITGETDFASIIERETRRRVRKIELLQWSFPSLPKRASL